MADETTQVDVKPGYKTTEFWITIICQIIGVLAMIGVLTPDQSDAIIQGITQIVGGIVMGASAFGYSLSRGNAKLG